MEKLLTMQDVMKKYNIGRAVVKRAKSALYPDRIIKNGKILFTEKEAQSIYEYRVHGNNHNTYTIIDDKTAILTMGKYKTIIDREDIEKLSVICWNMCGKYIGKSYKTKNKKGKATYLHVYIMNPPTGKMVDHINGDKMDNRKSNLRICTHADNIKNTKMKINNTSGYKGVYYYKNTNKWKAQIGINNKRIALGYFNTAEEAYAAYCKAAKELHGEFARLA